MRKTWQLQEAKNKFSELVEKAIQDGPQRITRRGNEAAVMLSSQDYARLRRGEDSLVDFFRRSPLRDVALDRVKDFPREAGL